ncbi:MAG: hypothetical protein KBS81_00400, partial [Spirochaetales bacterium]|nr:hypothetical protein [Candidatus Physcosoma equi]
MEYIVLGALALIVLLLIVLIVLVSQRRTTSGSVEETDILRIKEEVRQGNEESFDRFQRTLDRDMERFAEENKELR